MPRLDYISCLLTIVSTILVGRRLWHGWVLAAVNSVIICIIGLRTAQSGFIAANLFCLAIYGFNLMKWRTHDREQPSTQSATSDTLTAVQGFGQQESSQLRTRAVSNEQSHRHSDRIRPRRLHSRRKSHASF